ncbi:hypothetical protein Tco_0011745 [Tanacetum coccineum]
MHKKRRFSWTPESEEAFKQFKNLVAEPSSTNRSNGKMRNLIISLAAAKKLSAWSCKQTMKRNFQRTLSLDNKTTDKAYCCQLHEEIIRKNDEVEVRVRRIWTHIDQGPQSRRPNIGRNNIGLRTTVNKDSGRTSYGTRSTTNGARGSCFTDSSGQVLDTKNPKDRIIPMP